MKLNHRQRQAVNDTFPVLGDIQTLEHGLSDEIEGLHEGASAAVEAALGRNHGNRSRCSCH